LKGLRLPSLNLEYTQGVRDREDYRGGAANAAQPARHVARAASWSVNTMVLKTRSRYEHRARAQLQAVW